MNVTSSRGKIIIGRDTRESGPDIVSALTDGADSLQCKVRFRELYHAGVEGGGRVIQKGLEYGLL